MIDCIAEGGGSAEVRGPIAEAKGFLICGDKGGDNEQSFD